MNRVSLLHYLATVALALTITITSAFGQAPAKIFSEVYYHKLKPGHTLAEARAIENEFKKIHQLQADAGTIFGWSMMALDVTSNPSHEYDYITTKSFGSLAHLDNSYPQATLEKVLGADYKAKWADLNKRIAEVQEGVKIEVWEGIDYVANPNDTPGKTPILMVSYLRIKNNQYTDYIDRAKSIKKIYEEDIKAGRDVKWSLWSLELPWATEKGYDFASIVGFSSMKALGDWRSANEDAFRKAMPGTDMKQFYKELSTMRETARQDLFYEVEYAVKAPTTTAKK